MEMVRGGAIPTARRHLEADELDLTWLGQAGFLVEWADARIVIDPYLSDSLASKYRGARYAHERMAPAPVAPGELRDVDLVLATHAHSDHLDPDTLPELLAVNPHARLVVPRSCLRIAIERGAPAERIHALESERRCDFGRGIAITAIPSAHEQLAVDADGDPLCVGFLIELGRHRLYHSGDCVPYPGLRERLERADVDIALLPVNGRDEERRRNGVPGNFTLQEAAELATGAGARRLIGHHFGMFAFNTIDVDAGRAWLAERYQREPERLLLAESSCRYVFHKT